MTVDNLQLDHEEQRVVGVLIEKSLAQPDYYPMTLNAIITACNQKQNRDPVLSLSEESVLRTLDRLKLRSIVTLVLPGPGARVNRYKHCVDSAYGWQKRERAVMCELLLRGAQTVGELKTRCSRLVPFDTLDAVTIVLDCLQERTPAQPDTRTAADITSIPQLVAELEALKASYQQLADRIAVLEQAYPKLP